MDVSHLSTADLKALQSGDITQMSTEGLKMIAAGTQDAPAAPPMASAQNPTQTPSTVAEAAQQPPAQPVAQDGQQPQTEQGPSNPAQKSMLQEFARQGGLAARYGMEGLGSFADLPTTVPYNATQSLLSYITQKPGFPIQSLGGGEGSISHALDAIGMPKPQGAEERVVGDISRAVASAGSGILAGGSALMRYAAPELADMLAAAPGVQLGAAVGSSGAAGVTREAGGGDIAQFIASLAGGLGGGAAAAKTLPEGMTNLTPSQQYKPTGSAAEKDISKEIMNSPDAPKQLSDAKLRLMEADKSGVPLALGEAMDSPSLMARTGQLENFPETSGQAKEFFDTRSKLVTDSLKNIGDNISPHQTVDDAANAVQGATDTAIKRLQKNMSDQAAPFYEEAYTKKVPPTAMKSLQTKYPIIGQVLDKVTSDPLYAQELGDQPTNSISVIDQAKKEMDDMIATARQGGERNKARLLTDAKSQLVKIADKYAPSYAQGRDIYAYNAQEDMPKIEKYLGGLVKENKTPDQVVKALFDGTANNTKVIAGEIGQEAAQAGAKGKLLQALETNKGKTDLGIPSKIYGSDRDVSKWQAALGDKFNDFDSAMKTIEQAAKGSNARPNVGSQTQIRSSQMENLNEGIGAATNALTHNYMGILKSALDKVTGKQNPKYLQDTADILLGSKGQDLINKLSKAKFPSRQQTIVNELSNMITSRLAISIGTAEGSTAHKRRK